MTDLLGKTCAINCNYDKAFEQAVSERIRVLKARGLEAHTRIKGGSLIVVKRRPKRSRLTGEPR